MDRNDPPIIKSGARHSVQVAQGTKNAKSVRNVVTSDADAPLNDRFAHADESTERGTAVLQQGLTQEQQVGQSRTEGGPVEAQASAATNIVDEPSPLPVAGDGVAFDLSPVQQPASTGPSVVREELAMQDGTAAKSQPEAEHRILIDEETGPADTEGVVVDGRQHQDNRQRIEQLQAQANRIRLEAEQRQLADVNHARPGERSLRTHEVTTAHDESASRPESPAANNIASPSVPAAEAVAQVPPEVMDNLDHQAQQALNAKESALMARLRALKSNMSVTENRLTKLKTPESPDT